MGGGTCGCRPGGRSGIKVGDRLQVGVVPEEAHDFDDAGQRLGIFDKAGAI
jgi:hypothetical protein